MIDNKNLLKILEKQNPFEYGTEAMSGSKTQRNNRRKRNQGYMTALEVLERVLSNDEAMSIDESRHFLQVAYGIRSEPVNWYHLKLYHDEYEGWFDWYHTRGTLIANRNGGATNIGKYKGDEDCALAIRKHIDSIA